MKIKLNSDILKRSWNKKENYLGMYISDVEDRMSEEFMWKVVEVINEDTGNSRKFEHYRTDTDGTGEDIYGWNYIDKKTGMKLLIIND